MNTPRNTSLSLTVLLAKSPRLPRPPPHANIPPWAGRMELSEPCDTHWLGCWSGGSALAEIAVLVTVGLGAGALLVLTARLTERLLSSWGAASAADTGKLE